MNRLHSSILLALAAAGFAACGAGGENAPDTELPSEVAKGDDACPQSLTGTTSTIQDTVDGLVVIFATSNQRDIAVLRQRVERLADVHNSTRAAAARDSTVAPPQGPGPGPRPSGSDAAELVATASVEPGDKDVRLVLRPADPSQLDRVRDALRQQADDLVRTACAKTEQRQIR